MTHSRPSTWTTLAATELLLSLLEGLVVLWPLNRYFPAALPLSGILAAAALLLWVFPVLYWLRPVFSSSSQPPEGHYRRALAVPAKAVVLRLLLWEVLGIQVAFSLSSDLPLDRIPALLAVFLLHPLGMGLVRWTLYGRLIRARLEHVEHAPPWIQLQADTLKGRLVGLSLVTSVGAVLLSALFCTFFVPLTSAQSLQVQSYWSWTALGLGLLWYVLVAQVMAPLLAYIQQANSDKTAALRQLQSALISAHRLPEVMAGIKLVFFVLGSGLCLMEALTVLTIPALPAVLILLAAATFGIGAAGYEMNWTRAELRPVITHLMAQQDAASPDLQVTPLRRKMLFSFGGAALFSTALAALMAVAAWSNRDFSLPGLAAFSVLILAAGVGLVLLTSADLTRPLGALERRAAEMTQGFLTREVFHEGEYDTSGRLSSAFEQMRRTLLRKLRTIEKLNQDLEQKVRLRTAELEASNKELQQAIKALQEAQQRLITSEKMASVGQLVAGIAHEINNPINAVVNTVTPLSDTVDQLTEAVGRVDEEGQQTRQDLQQMLRVIRSGSERALRIVQALRNYAREDGEEVSRVDLHADIEESLALLEHELSGVEVLRKFHSEEPVRAFRGQLNQAMMNLLSNAAAAVAGVEGARVVVRTRDAEGQLEIQVEDNGPGIPEEIQGRIFDPFFTTKDVGQGTGLGLSITHGIVERHHGRISVESEPGRTVITVEIPSGGVRRSSRASRAR